MKRLAIAAALCGLAVNLGAQVQKRDVDIKGADGATLKGTYYSPGRSGPAMLLLHQCHMDRHAWDTLAQDLANTGFNGLTVDFRGFGQSAGDKAQRDKWPGDVDAAFAYLMAQKD